VIPKQGIVAMFVNNWWILNSLGACFQLETRRCSERWQHVGWLAVIGLHYVTQNGHTAAVELIL